MNTSRKRFYGSPKFYRIGPHLNLLLKHSKRVGLPRNNGDVKEDLYETLQSTSDDLCCFNAPQDAEKISKQLTELSIWLKRVDQEYVERIKKLCETISLSSTIISGSEEDDEPPINDHV